MNFRKYKKGEEKNLSQNKLSYRKQPVTPPRKAIILLRFLLVCTITLVSLAYQNKEVELFSISSYELAEINKDDPRYAKLNLTDKEQINNRVKSKNDNDVSSLYSRNNITIKKKNGESVKDLLLHPVSSLILNGENIIIFNFGALCKYHGLGSIMSILAYISIFFEDEGKGHKVVLIQSDLKVYRYNATLGYFGGFTEQQMFYVINSKNELDSIYDQVREHKHSLEMTSVSTSNQHPTYDKNSKIIYYNFHDGNHVKLIQFYLKVKEYLCSDDPSEINKAKCLSLRTRITKKILSYMNYTQDTIEKINAAQQHAWNNDIIYMNQTVGFHVRRGDKIKEVEHTPTDNYVKTLVENVPEAATSIKFCILASTDPEVVFSELQNSLNKYNVTCKLYLGTALTTGISRIKPDDTISLLAEIDMLSKAKYFVGTFTSNIAKSVVLPLRGFQNWENVENGANMYGNFQSFDAS